MSLPSKVNYALRRIGVRGIIKSAYYSRKYTDSLTQLVLHPSVDAKIASDTEFDIGTHLSIGEGFPKSSITEFRTQSGSSVSQTGDGPALICGDSFVRIEGDFSIGNSWINHGAYIRCKDDITIGDDCAVSWNVDIIDFDGHQFIHEDIKKPKQSSIRIQDNVWIGYNSSINKGVTIHKGSVIASNSTVTSDIPPNTLAAGSPAEVVRENISWEH